MNYTIAGYSTALFSTWYFIEELGLLLDGGDGIISALLQKAGKIKNVFISHADRDHLTGLLQLNQLNAREGFPVIHYPADARSIKALELFSKQFDEQVQRTIWKGIRDKDEIRIKDNIIVQAVRNNHVPAKPSVAKSLGYKIYEVKNKLKPTLLHLSQEEIIKLAAEKGKESLTTEVRNNSLSYSGDTPVADYGQWDNCETLIHEATFLDADKHRTVKTHGNLHSSLEEVMKMVAEIKLERLVLGHFSSRYANKDIDERIKALCREYLIKIPVFRLLPGETYRNLLDQEPIN